jgi:ADP-L-glycero-D-manno-heptose 6-epimerase
MAIVVTGGAGFIGSCIVGMLNSCGRDDIYIVDNINTTEKWKHIANKKYIAYIHKDEYLDVLSTLSGQVSHIIHMGDCSSTTEKDFDYLYKNNFEYTKRLWQFCTEENISFIYASSAATYGDGEDGFDDMLPIDSLRPLNGYGYSKQLFDQWVEKQTATPKQYVGFKFFNVYGPNEDCKGDMASVIFKAFGQINETSKVKLFTSHKEGYGDGGQLRDFIYVKDICKVIHFMMEHKSISGLFNLGTGKARSFADLAKATFAAMGKPENIEYIPMPMHLREKYQYFTQATMDKLRSVGYTDDFYSLEDGARDYVQNYLIPGKIY